MPGVSSDPVMPVASNDDDFRRYKYVDPEMEINAENRLRSLRMSKDVKCEVCELLVKSLIPRAATKSEDAIMDLFDAPLEGRPNLTGDLVLDQVEWARTGCNKHFKDELILNGWAVLSCGVAADGHERFCLEQLKARPTRDQADYYHYATEALFHACDATIGRKGAEVAKYLSERLAVGASGDLGAIARAACREAASCGAAGERKRKKKGQVEKRQKLNRAKEL